MPSGALWRNTDFIRLWAAQTISVFGTMITGTALPFTAILTLDATPLHIALLQASRIVPAIAIAPFAGVWVDRLPRRPLMMAADLGRAAILATVPLAWAFDALTIEQLYAVSFGAGVLTMFFDVAFRSFLPAIVERDELLDANSKLTASSAVAEFGGFSVSGWLVQLLAGPLAILADACSFVASAAFLRTIRRAEPPADRSTAESVWDEAADGFRAVASSGVLRTIAAITAIYSAAFGMFGAVFLVFATRELGFGTGVLGMIFAVGGVSSLAGALLAGRAARVLGVGPSMAAGVLFMGLSMLLAPAAQGATLVAAALLLAQQVTGDGMFTVFQVNEMSLRQSVTDGRMLGRINAFMGIMEQAFLLAGTLAGGALGETLGLRPTLVTAACALTAGAAMLYASPVRAVRSAYVAAEVTQCAPAAGGGPPS